MRKSCTPLAFILAFVTTFMALSCKKSPSSTTAPNPPPTPNDTTQRTSNSDTTGYASRNKWSCQIEGETYNGSIDTSFFTIINLDRSEPDTVVDCNGTTYDKRANIHFRFIVNRRLTPGPISTAANNGVFIFDTSSSSKIWMTSVRSAVQLGVDTLTANKLSGRFHGTFQLVGDYGSNSGFRTITNGAFSCEFAKGNNEPKYFSYSSGTSSIAGYVNRARSMKTVC